MLKLPKPPNNFGIQSLDNYCKKCNLKEKLLFAKIESDKVFKILKSFDESKAPGIDDLSGIFLKAGDSLLATPVTQLCNLSISSGRFPDACKIAKLKPLFKKGSKTDPRNYRPISLLALMSKELERIVHEQTIDFLDKHNILCKFQSGFGKDNSTDFRLSYVTDKITKGFDSGLLTGMILIDLQKAFDTIDHNILLLKMPSLGFSSEVIDWYKSYLSKLAWYPNLNKRLKSKLQTVQNRCIRYCFQLDNRSQVRVKHFEKINWLPVSERFNQYLCSNVFNFF